MLKCKVFKVCIHTTTLYSSFLGYFGIIALIYDVGSIFEDANLVCFDVTTVLSSVQKATCLLYHHRISFGRFLEGISA